MGAFKKDILRKCILLQLNASYPASMTLFMILQGIKINGLNSSEEDIERELEYLRERGFLTLFSSELSAGLKRAKISAKGIDYLESEGF